MRCLLFYAAWFELEVSTSDVRALFMHVVASEPKFSKPPVEQRAAGVAVADQESSERNENSAERFR